MKEKRDYAGLVVALLLLVGSAVWFLWSSHETRDRRDAVLATVPDFPRANQPATPRRAQPGVPVRPRPPAPVAHAGMPADPMNAFVLAPGQAAGLVSVNALLNTPVFDRIKECMPADFARLDNAAKSVGIDLQRDIDRVGMVPGGMMMSGFFDGKPVAEQMAAKGGGPDSHHDYRGAQVFDRGGECIAQMGNYVFVGKRNNCDALIDRAMTAPQGDSSQDVYGDIWFHTDVVEGQGPAKDPRLAPILEAMKDVTLRANVWDSVAVSVEGTPKTKQESHELVQMARGAISVAKNQFDDEDVEMKALADLAKVRSEDGKMQVDLAVPAKDLFDRLHLPCPGRADGGTPGDGGPQQ